jgi:hypothetical protein
VIYLTGLFESGESPFSSTHVIGQDVVFGAAGWTTQDCELQRLLSDFHSEDAERFDSIVGALPTGRRHSRLAALRSEKLIRPLKKRTLAQNCSKQNLDPFIAIQSRCSSSLD